MWFALIANGHNVANQYDNLKRVDEITWDFLLLSSILCDVFEEKKKFLKVLRSYDDLFILVACCDLLCASHRLQWIFNFFFVILLSSYYSLFSSNLEKKTSKRAFFLMSKVYRLCRLGGEGNKRSSLCCVYFSREIWKNVR
jgi:hypothetical protein